MPRHQTSSISQEAAHSTKEVVASPFSILKRYYDAPYPRPKGTSETPLFNAGLSTMAAASEDQEPLPKDLPDRLLPRQTYIVSSHALQRWDGYVLDIGANSFRGRLTDLTNRNEQPDVQEVEIPLEELDADSRARLAPGCLFQWSIGYELSRSGQKTRFSRIVLRHIPTWTNKELDQARAEAKEVAQALRWE